MKKLVLIKIGGSLITDKAKPLTVHENMLDAAAEGVGRAILDFPEYQFIVGNGAGSFAHYVASQTHTGNSQDRIRAIHESAITLNSIFATRLRSRSLAVETVVPADCIVAHEGSLKDFDSTSIDKLLSEKITPLVFGDIVDDSTERGMIFSTEMILEILAEKLRSQYALQVLYVGEAPGVLDTEGIVIPQISTETWKDMGHVIVAPKGYDVTGGMQHKVESALHMATIAESVHILSGKDPKNISAALRGADVGTKIVA